MSEVGALSKEHTKSSVLAGELKMPTREPKGDEGVGGGG